MISSMNLCFRLSFTKVIFFDAGFPKHYLTMSHLPCCVRPHARVQEEWKAQQWSRDKSLEGHSSITLISRVVQQGDPSQVLWLPHGSQGNSSEEGPELQFFTPPAPPARLLPLPGTTPQHHPSPFLPFIHLTLNEWHT